MDFRPTPPARLLPMTFKKIWFQLHWFVGITAGTVLIVIGLSGAVFSFHEEILGWMNPGTASVPARSEEHTSELQSPCNLVCRLLLEKKKIINIKEQSVCMLEAHICLIVSSFNLQIELKLSARYAMAQRTYIARRLLCYWQLIDAHCR